MGILELIFAIALTVGFILVLLVLIRAVRRGGINMFLYPVSRSSKGITENHAKVRTPPGRK